ncbi:MAG: PhnD/SsuA/transferrin family substrate-binding protein [Actinomycetota bacterium]|nr:PhnD/SsuA/transferrin family substrate-binding protein [Actinomycetota bacterium]
MEALRFGTFLAPSVLPVYQAVTSAVGNALGIPVRLADETSYASYLEDRNDVSFVCSLAHIVFERRSETSAIPVAAPVLTDPRYGGAPIYFSDVIVHRDSPFHSFEDLRGRSWAFNETLSHSGYGITRYHLLQLGEVDGFFGNVVKSGLHSASIGMVANHAIDASGIDSHVLAVAMRDKPELADRLRIVETLGPSTIQPVTISSRIEPQLRSDITEVLLSLHDDPAVAVALAHGFVERFAAVGPESYDDIRGMLDACEAADFMEVA